MRSLAAGLVILLSFPVFAQEAKPSPEDFWNALVTGNKEYVKGTITYDHLKEERAELADHQFPPMTILSCSDSRVPPELVFNQSIGALFVVRAAGNIADSYGIASVEYAIAQGYTSLLVVLGHENCGAVKAAMATGDPGSPSLLGLVERIRMSFRGGEWNSEEPAMVRKAVDENTRASAAALLAQSSIIRDAVTSGKVKLVCAYYDLHTGEVKKLD
jgi:carbonic anhydrase